jgi:hypothetical protein
MDNTSNSLMPRYDSKNILFPATVSFFFFLSLFWLFWGLKLGVLSLPGRQLYPAPNQKKKYICY